jgi:hypothetical protein
VPTLVGTGHAPARFTGYTAKDVMYSPEKFIHAWTRYMEEVEQDVFPTPNVRNGYVWDTVKPKSYKWAGNGLPDNCSPRCVELELLKAHELTSFMANASDFHLRTYLKRVVEGCVAEGLVPVLFAEGAYNSRLEIVKELPKVSVIWHFDQTDIKRAKEILGSTACIMGNIPTSKMVTGTPSDVKAYC